MMTDRRGAHGRGLALAGRLGAAAQAERRPGLGAVAAGHAGHRLDGAHGVLIGRSRASRRQLASLPIVKSCVYYSQAAGLPTGEAAAPTRRVAGPHRLGDARRRFSCIPTVPSDAFTVESDVHDQPGVYLGDRARAADPSDEPRDSRSRRSSSWRSRSCCCSRRRCSSSTRSAWPSSPGDGRSR